MPPELLARWALEAPAQAQEATWSALCFLVEVEHAAVTQLPLPADHVLVTFESRLSQGGFIEEDGWIWARDGQLIAHSRQLALLQAPSHD